MWSCAAQMRKVELLKGILLNVSFLFAAEATFQAAKLTGFDCLFFNIVFIPMGGHGISN